MVSDASSPCSRARCATSSGVVHAGCRYPWSVGAIGISSANRSATAPRWSGGRPGRAASRSRSGFGRSASFQRAPHSYTVDRPTRYRATTWLGTCPSAKSSRASARRVARASALLRAACSNVSRSRAVSCTSGIGWPSSATTYEPNARPGTSADLLKPLFPQLRFQGHSLPTHRIADQVQHLCAELVHVATSLTGLPAPNDLGLTAAMHSERARTGSSKPSPQRWHPPRPKCRT